MAVEIHGVCMYNSFTKLIRVLARTCLTACCHYSDILPENWSTLLQSLLFTSTQ